jgi:hypothetical protein
MVGVPHDVVHGREYGDKLLSVPVALEWDRTVGGFKIVTKSETAFAERDGFGRSRVSNPETLFDGQFRYDESPLLWQSRLDGGSVMHLPAQGAVRLRAAADEEALYQTRRYFPYQAGKSQLVQMTGLFPTQAGATARAGYFDDNDGIYFQVADGVASFVVRSSVSGAVVNTLVPQSSWSEDGFDGSGPSGLVLDLTKGQNIVFDMQWLGIGRVRCGFDDGGVKYYVHVFDFSNKIALPPYMLTATLPVRYEVVGATGMAGNADLTAVCSAVMSEGGLHLVQGFPFHAHKLTATTVDNDPIVPLVSIRPKATFNSLVNRTWIVPKRVSALNDGQVPAHVYIIYGGALTNPSWADVNAESAVERDISATAIAGGIHIDGMFLPSGNGNQTQGLEQGLIEILPLTLDVDGGHPTSPLTDVLTIAASTMEAQTTSVFGMVSWSELR